MSAARKIHTLTFHLLGISGEDAMDDIIDEIEEFADGVEWPIEAPDAFKHKVSETDPDTGCAVELPVRASLAGETIAGEKADFAGAIALIEHLRQLSARHRFDVEITFDKEIVGTIDKGAYSETLRQGLVEPWQVG
ncbi:hypothetical protein AB4037_06090 [Labrys sp. KB_33_2]|uniref:hypothetical protein n=1 Tax=unclassified Labrys (in: a-proteobacteria) TaxID=2688601 RepID=UPI003EBADB46